MPTFTRRQVLASTAAAATLGCRSARAPNIVYIYADQHRAPLLGSYGATYVQTPHLDALAANGLQFDNCFTNSPLCRPARASMMTGLLPGSHGSWSNNYISDRRDASHVRTMRSAGYRTAMFGKAHLDLTNMDTRDPRAVARLEDWGFVDVMELLSQPHAGRIANPYAAFLRDTTPPGEPPKDERYADYVDEWSYVVGNVAPESDPYRLATEDHLDVFCGREAAAYLQQREGDDQPFYLQVNFPGPHSPFDSPVEHRERYRIQDMPLPVRGAPTNAGELVDYLHRNKPELQGLTDDEYRFVLLTYVAKISLIDDMVGMLMSTLRRSGLLDDTWVIYHSDHGELVGDHELWGKVAMYDGALRVPLIMRPPGGTVGRTSLAMVDQRDVTETLLDIGGQSGVGGGRSLREAALGGPDPGREQIVAMVEGHFSRGGGLRTAMVRTERHKLIRDLSGGEDQVLYDLDADPGEQVNRIDDADYSSVVSDLKDRLEAELAAARG